LSAGSAASSRSRGLGSASLQAQPSSTHAILGTVLNGQEQDSAQQQVKDTVFKFGRPRGCCGVYISY
jgi:hypothetical protein